MNLEAHNVDVLKLTSFDYLPKICKVTIVNVLDHLQVIFGNEEADEIILKYGYNKEIIKRILLHYDKIKQEVVNENLLYEAPPKKQNDKDLEFINVSINTINTKTSKQVGLIFINSLIWDNVTKYENEIV